MNKIELLAPAKDLETGIAAINFGADAVYIGGPEFGARAAAGNSIKDIQQLCNYAHLFNVKVYVTINTILFDSELNNVEQLIHKLYDINIDAIIIQDMGILEMELPPIPIFASTQTNNYSWQKVKFLEDTGIKRVILARELSLEQIKEIKENTSVDLEFFIHGALCVSLSGQCYFSHAIGKGSANRGACAQPCRSYYDLKDKSGKTIVKNKHLLSLKDLNLTNHISELLDAGITSFKIEGRLKDVNYVKNIVGHYRKHIDKVLEKRKDYSKASSGIMFYDFNPDPDKTFNRAYTNYFLKARNQGIASFDTPKSLGKQLGKVNLVTNEYFTLDSNHKIINGDGLCFFNKSGILLGFNVNKTEDSKIFFDNTVDISPGTVVYRNYDHKFNSKLNNSKTERKINLEIQVQETKSGLLFTATDSDKNTTQLELNQEFETAKNAELAFNNLKKQLSKSGDSIFKITDVNLSIQNPKFIPLSEINKIRRELLDSLIRERIKNRVKTEVKIEKTNHPYPEKTIDYKGNILNKNALKFYERHGVKRIENAFETQSNFDSKEIMTTRQCINYQLDACKKYNKNAIKLDEPLFLEDNNRKYQLQFNCKDCLMTVIYKNN